MAIKHEIRFFIFIALAFASGMFMYATLTDDDKQKQEFEQNYRIYSLPIPQKVSFAGVNIPLKEYDVAERYDREILTNVYWQSQTLMLLKRSQRFLPTIDRILRENNIPSDFKYLAMAESGLQNVSSPAGAAGFWQFLDKTAKRYKLDVNEDVDERYHLEKATQDACLYFKEAHAIFNDWALVAASYNMGIEGVRRQMQNQQMKSYFDLYLNVETARYLFRIIAIKDIYENPTKFGFHIPANHYYKEVPTVKVKVDLSISQISEWAIHNNCNYKLLKLLNPWLRKAYINVTPGKTYYIALPKDRIMQSELASKVVNDTLSLSQTSLGDMPKEDLMPIIEHKVEKDESIESIAIKYAVKPEDICTLNNLKAKQKLIPGTVLKINKTKAEDE
jgi:hypothetical protein